MSRITELESRVVPDSRGDSTIEVRIKFDSGAEAKASVPQGKSRGRFEASCLEPLPAVANVNNVIFPALKGRIFKTQNELDEFLLSLDGTFSKSKLGANAILGVSLAFARTAALEGGVPLWRKIRENAGLPATAVLKKPRLLVNIIGGGRHAKNNLYFQEYLVIPKAQEAGEALEIAQRIYQKTGEYLKNKFGTVPLADEGNFAPDLAGSGEPFSIIKEAAAGLGLADEIDFGLDAAATNVKKNPEELFREYGILKEKYSLFYLEDPFNEEDFAGFSRLLKEMHKNTLIVGDDLTTTSVTRMEMAHQQKSINSVIIKPNQIGTLTETIEAVKKAQEYGWAIIVSHRSGETNDDFIADLAYGVGADGLKAGAPSAPERLVKYQRLTEIERSA